MDSQQETPSAPSPSDKPVHTDVGDEHYQSAQKVLTSYLLERSEVFRRLSDLQKHGWQSADGDEFFRKQRQTADQADEKTQRYFYKMMQEIGKDMHDAVDAFNLHPPNNAKPRILDMCVAPGGFVSSVLSVQPRAEVVGFTLPVSAGGHQMRLGPSARVRMTYVDITMLAGDLGLGADEIPPDHPDRDQFILERRLPAPPAPQGPGEGAYSADFGLAFDLAFCGGQVLRTHPRAAYREPREARRLSAAQLALALARLRPGGTLVVRLHHPGGWGAAQVLWTVSRLTALVRLFKPQPAHAKRGSFYLVARGVRSRDPEALAAVRRWQREWRVATFGTDAEYADALRNGVADVHALLADFGPRLIELATPVWEIQAQALAKAPWMKQA